jgi:hypothetical protein
MDKDKAKQALINIKREIKFAELCKLRLKEREAQASKTEIKTAPGKYTSKNFVNDVFGSTLIQGKTFSQTINEAESKSKRNEKAQPPMKKHQTLDKKRPSIISTVCLEDQDVTDYSVNNSEIKKTCDEIFSKSKSDYTPVNKIKSSDDNLNILGNCQLLASNRFYLLNDYEGTADEVLRYKEDRYEEVTYKEKKFRIRRPLMPKYKIAIKESIIEEYFDEPLVAGLHPLEFAYITTPIYKKERLGLSELYDSFLSKIKEIREKIYINTNIVNIKKEKEEQSWIKSISFTDLYYLYGEQLSSVN